MSDFHREIMTRCLKNDAYLKTLQKALVFDEDDIDDFENNYHELIEELIKENWVATQLGF